MAAEFVFNDKKRVGDWVAEQVDMTGDWGSYYAMGLERDGELIAGVVFNGMNESNASAHIACKKMSKMFPELVDHAVLYAFKQCGLRRLTGYVDASNKKALKLDKHIGFEEEGVMRKAASDGGDVIVLVLWPENYRKDKHHG